MIIKLETEFKTQLFEGANSLGWIIAKGHYPTIYKKGSLTLLENGEALDVFEWGDAD